MLFMALTRSGIQQRLPRCSREFPFAPGWLLTSATDDFLSHLSISKDEIVASESLLGGEGGPDRDVSFISARFLPALPTLLVSKSPVSGRPLYYCTNSRGEFLASTHISWLRRAGVPIEEDADVLPELLVYRVVAPPRTLYRGIRQLPVAGSIVVSLKDGDLLISEETRSYDPPDSPSAEPEEERIWRVEETLKNEVGKLSPVASQVATLLSGGVDSSILSAIAQSQLSASDTYSTSYPYDKFETNFEQQYALSAANALGTRHTLFVPNETDFLSGFVEALATAEAPLNHLQSILLHLLFKNAVPDQTDRVICGEGADSVFGLDTHFALHKRPNLRQRILSLPPMYVGLRALGSGWRRARAAAAHIGQFRALRLPIADPYSPIWSYAAYGDFEWVRKQYGASREQVVEARSQQLQLMPSRSFNDALAIYALNYSDVAVTTTVWSKLGEGQRKILYYPFASQDILDAAFSIPWGIKLKSKKHVVRGVGKLLGVPDFILNRRKQSFGIVSDRWAEKGGPLEPILGLAAKAVDIRQLRDLQGRDPSKAMTLWSLLNYAVLIRLFVMGESKESLLEELVDNHMGQKGIKRQQMSRTIEQAGNAA
jgi:asparagine synthetase B (glutamine-hydrolysing)